MSDETIELGGRLPLVDPETLTTTQRDLYDRMDAAMAPWADRMGFQSKTADGRYIGPFNPILFSPEIGGSFLALQHVEEEHTALSGRIRQIVILSVGSVWQAAYELYAHAAAGRAAGLSVDAVRDLSAGRTPTELNEQERIAQQFTLQLAAELHVEDELYRTAAGHFGEKGLVDMVVLAGCYHMVCSLLNAFAVPAPPRSRVFQRTKPFIPEETMKMPSAPQAQLTVVAEFPEKFFLENLAVREDGSILVTALNRNELWLVPTPAEQSLVEPALVHIFEFNTMFVVEWRPDRFLVGVSDVYNTRDARLYEMDMRGWTAGLKAAPRLLLDFPEPKVGLNGGCLLAPNVLLAAGAANVIWRVDLADDGTASARIWLQHDNMKNRPGEMKPDQPGTNGVQYAARSGYVFYTTTSQQLMMRVRVDPRTLDPVDLPEFIAGGRQWDDFLIDEDAQVAYATTHRENTIDRVKLEPDGNRSGRTVVAGEPFTDVLIGPSSGAWRRGSGDHGRTAYFATDGGTAAPPDGVFRTAKLLRVVFPAAP